MAYYAQLDSDNIVVTVFVGRDDVVEGVDDWETYYAPAGFTVKQTSYTGDFRFNYAGIGYSYDSARDAFISPNPFPSWSLDEATCQWVAPTPKPDGEYVWDEQAGEWVEA
jgi:hypothetical protein